MARVLDDADSRSRSAKASRGSCRPSPTPRSPPSTGPLHAALNQAGIGDDFRDNVFVGDGKRERWTLLKAEFVTRLDLNLDHAATLETTFTEEAKAAARESEGKGFFRKPH